MKNNKKINNLEEVNNDKKINNLEEVNNDKKINNLEEMKNNKEINDLEEMKNNKKIDFKERDVADTQMKTPMVPRQIKSGLKSYKEVKPFANEYLPNTRWWLLDVNPSTISGYSMPNLGYINILNSTAYSDVVMNAYRHRHYIFGVQYDEDNNRKHYIYGIPGTIEEKPDNGNTGFNRYLRSDRKDIKSKGYWLCFIDAKLRNIKK
jgi:hypothetical protein